MEHLILGHLLIKHMLHQPAFTGGNSKLTLHEILLWGKTYDGNTDAASTTITRMAAQGTCWLGSGSNTSNFNTGLVSGGVTYFLPVNVADSHSSRETLISGTGTAIVKMFQVHQY